MDKKTQSLICIGVLSFVFSWTLTSLYQMWTMRHQDREACQTSMRFCWVGTKHLPPVAATERLAKLKRVMFDGFTPTAEENKILLNGYQAKSGVLPIKQAQWAMLCAQDPKFPIKVLMSRTTTLDFEPSYQFPDDPKVAVYCPFHHQALLSDGSVSYGIIN